MLPAWQLGERDMSERADRVVDEIMAFYWRQPDLVQHETQWERIQRMAAEFRRRMEGLK